MSAWLKYIGTYIFYSSLTNHELYLSPKADIHSVLLSRNMAAGMKDYNAASGIQKDIVTMTLGAITGAASAVAERVSKGNSHSAGAPSLVFVDFGSSEGANSIPAIRVAIQAVRKVLPKSAISVVHEDLARFALRADSRLTVLRISTNWCALFQLTENPEISYRFASATDKTATADAKASDNVFTFASGTTFFEQVVPSGSLHFGFSANAVRAPNRSCCYSLSNPARRLAQQADRDP